MYNALLMNRSFGWQSIWIALSNHFAMRLHSRQLLNLTITLLVNFTFLIFGSGLHAQPNSIKRNIVVDVAHGQRFYDDPATTKGNEVSPVERVKYMAGELEKNASSLNAQVRYQKTRFTSEDLAKCDLLFIHIPSAKYSSEEIKAIHQYLQNGGSMFIVMDADFWSTLAQTNVNDITSPFGIVYKNDNPDAQTSGGYSKAGAVTATQLIIPCHGWRMLEGGTAFCFSKKGEDNPIGTYKELKKGGRIIAMGEGMVSLYMTKWENVDNYQCSEFMRNAFAWLLK